MEIPLNDSIGLLKKVENIVAKGEIARFEQFLLLSQCFKSCLLQRHRASVCGKGLIH